MDPELFNIVHKEVNSHVHLHSGPNPQCKPWEIPDTSHMGPPPSSFTNLAVQAFQPSNYTHPNPLLVPQHTSCCPYWQGAHTFMVSTHVCPQYTPYTPNTPYQIYIHSYSSAILVSFLYFYLLD